MSIEINLRKTGDLAWMAAYGCLVIAVLVGLSMIGRQATPPGNGIPGVLTWSDWQILQAQREHTREIILLRKDAMSLLKILGARPDPVFAQLLVDRIEGHTRDGSPALAAARHALHLAAGSVLDWSTGLTGHENAMLAIQQVLPLLGE